MGFLDFLFHPYGTLNNPQPTQPSPPQPTSVPQHPIQPQVPQPQVQSQPTPQPQDSSQVVNLRNKKTGGVIQVRRADLPNYGLPVDYVSKIDAQTNLVKSGAVNIGDIAKTDPQTASFISSQAGVAVKPILSADDQKKADAKANAERLINQLEQQYYGGGPNTNLSYGRLTGVLQNVGAGLGFNPNLKTYQNTLATSRPTLARAFGDVGNLSLSEQQQAIKQLPTGTSTPEEAAKGFAAIRERFGLTPKDQTANLDKQATGNPLINFLMGSAINTAKDIGTGLALKIGGQGEKTLQSQQAAIESAQQLNKLADQTTDPTLKKRLLQQSLNTSMSTSQQAQADQGQFSADIGLNPLLRGLLTGLDVTSTAGLATGGLKAILNPKEAIQAPINAAKTITQPFRNVGNYRDAKILEAAGKTVSGDKLYSALEKGADGLSPTVRKGYTSYLEQAKPLYQGKDLTIKEVTDLNQSANTAYTAAGKVGKSASAQFNKVLGDHLKSELKAIAPEVAKANKLFSYLYQGKKIGGKAAGVAGSALVGALLYRTLFGGNQQ